MQNLTITEISQKLVRYHRKDAGNMKFSYVPKGAEMFSQDVFLREVKKSIELSHIWMGSSIQKTSNKTYTYQSYTKGTINVDTLIYNLMKLDISLT